jgi:enoyl-[acyl-carrier-protein] reductase (NADH)
VSPRSVADSAQEELHCVKYELKRLKGRVDSHQDMTTRDVFQECDVELDSDVENEVSAVRSEVAKFTQDLHCVKYQLRKLKAFGIFSRSLSY